MVFKAVLCFLFASLSLTLAGQQRVISGKFAGTFPQFATFVEGQSNYRFYFAPSDLDSFKVNIDIQREELSHLLGEVFRGSEYRFVIDTLNRVMITRRFAIQTSLADGFFSQTASSTYQPEEMPVDKEEKQVLVAAENRLYEIGNPSAPFAKNATIAGYVRDARSGEAISGAAVFIDTPQLGVLTDQYGYYSLTLPRGRHVLRVSSVGMKNTLRQVHLLSDGKLNVELQERVASLKEVIVVSERTSNVRSVTMGLERLNIKVLKSIPVVFGETDVLKAVLTVPGVTSVGEASTGIHVRGGSSDQNLILFNDATIYNPSHLFGFFSAFNADVIRDVELYKSYIPEKFGGRLSSVLDVNTRDGNKKKLSGIGGVGPLTARLTLEAPLIKERSSVLLSGRTTYSNWLLKHVPDEAYRNSTASFYDVTFHLSHAVNSKNSVYLTAYRSGDDFRLNSDTLYRYNNTNVNAKWKHVFNNKLNAVLSAGYDHYRYEVSSTARPLEGRKLSFDINQLYGKLDFNYSLAKHLVNFGFHSLYYKLSPGSVVPLGSRSLVIKDVLADEQASEMALYVGDQFTISPDLSLSAGLRYTLYNYLGPRAVLKYLAGFPKEVSTITDTVRYGSASIQTYHAPEFRFSARYVIQANSSLKVSFNTLRQYIHMLSNTTAISPTDIWKLSDPNIKPQIGSQLSLGYYHDFRSEGIETSVEVYYKRMKNFLDYKSGARLIMNHHIETDVMGAEGKAYGVELMIKKPAGKANGWISYTYSRTLLRMNDSLAGEVINGGAYYPANFDKPHAVNFIGNYRFTHRYSISLNVIYSTGRPITLPIATYIMAGSQRLLYADRNSHRIPDYFRADLSFQIEGNHKVKKRTHNFWSFGVYNLTGRDNAYSVYFTQENGVIKGYQLAVFGTQIPFITYNFRF